MTGSAQSGTLAFGEIIPLSLRSMRATGDGRSHCGDAIHLDVERAVPGLDADEAARRRIGWKIACVGCVDGRELRTSVQYTVHFTTLASDEPAAARQSFICSSTISVWRSTGKRLISPVAGSYGGMFDTNTKSPARIAMAIGTLRACA